MENIKGKVIPINAGIDTLKIYKTINFISY